MPGVDRLVPVQARATTARWSRLHCGAALARARPDLNDADIESLGM